MRFYLKYLQFSYHHYYSIIIMTIVINIIVDGKLFATQALSQTLKNVFEPQTGIEPCHLSPGSSLVRASPEIRRLRVRFPSGAQKHFSEFAIKLE